MIRAMLTVLALSASPAMAAETIVAGLSENRVSITANFDGSEILIYGAVKRETRVPDSRLDVIITIMGPSSPLVIRQKSRVLGIWLNSGAVTIDAAPSFYAVATTGPLDKILSATENMRHKITLEHVIRVVGSTAEADNAPDYVEALKRVRIKEHRYRVEERRVTLVEQTLFRTDTALPADLIEGNYTVRIFLLRDGKVIDSQERLIGVRKTGLERFLYMTAHESPFYYGLASLMLAVFAGWAASAGFRLLRR